MKYKLAIFDFDGTLADTRKAIVLSKQETMRRLGLEVADEETCAATIGMASYDGFRSVFPGESDETIRQCVKTYRQIFDSFVETHAPVLFEGVEEVLHKLADDGVKLAVASSRNLASLNDLLGKLGIRGLFEAVYGAESTEHLKPDPEPVESLLKLFGTDPKEVLVVGDMPLDISMGRGAGAVTCGVTFGNADRRSLLEAGADRVIDRFDELLDA
ncbi:MAG: HAD family hydrolase [Lachnospiraceae bacterium]|nr:HAD family hydrolase [Lachnospiraceae bacterium]